MQQLVLIDEPAFLIRISLLRQQQDWSYNPDGQRHLQTRIPSVPYVSSDPQSGSCRFQRFQRLLNRNILTGLKESSSFFAVTGQFEKYDRNGYDAPHDEQCDFCRHKRKIDFPFPRHFNDILGHIIHSITFLVHKQRAFLRAILYDILCYIHIMSQLDRHHIKKQSHNQNSISMLRAERLFQSRHENEIKK